MSQESKTEVSPEVAYDTEMLGYYLIAGETEHRPENGVGVWPTKSEAWDWWETHRSRNR